MATRIPPPEVPVITWDSPNKADTGLIELWNTEISSYFPLDVGAPHPNLRDFPNHRLGIQQALPNDQRWVRRVWVTDDTNQDWFNYELRFSSEASAYPIFIRFYQERRDTYTPRTKGAALQVVYRLTKTLSGSGYDPALRELALTFSGGAGTGAAGRALIAMDGTIASLVIDDSGTGYTSAPTFTIPAPAAGVTATGTASIQPTGSVLVKEEAHLYPPDSENFAIYFNVLRVWETLPGPVLFGHDYNAQEAFLVPYTTQIVASGTKATTPYTDVQPRDSVVDQVKTIDRVTLAGTYDAYSRSIPVAVDLDLPDVLSTLSVTFMTDGGDGSYMEAGSSSGLSWSLNLSGSANASAAVIPKLLYTIDRTPAIGVPAMQYEVLIPNPGTLVALKARLAAIIGGNPTINDWPKWRPKALNCLINSQKMSVEVRANSHGNASDTGNGQSAGTGKSVDFSPSLTQIDLPPTVHGNFTLTNTANTVTKTVSADASQTGVYGLPATISGSCSATGTISPSGVNCVAATSPAAIPTSGLYLYKYRGQNYRDGYLMFVCIVVDMSLV